MDTFFDLVVDDCHITAGIATETDELEGAFELRWQEYVEKRAQISRSEIEAMAQMHEMPELVNYFDHGFEVDFLDPISTNCIVKVNGRVVACLRLTEYDKPWRLDEEASIGDRLSLSRLMENDQEGIDPASTVEAARFLATDFQTPHGWWLNLSFLSLKTGLEACRRSGKRWWVLAGNVRILEYLRENGWPFRELNPAEFDYHGSRVKLATLRVPESTDSDYVYTLIKAPR